MKILRVKQGDGSLVDIPIGSGANGKSAYAYAQEGGYTGTEAEFATKLAEEGVTSVNGKTGAVTLSAGDIGAEVSGAANGAVSSHNSSPSAHNDIREQISQLSSEIADLKAETMQQTPLFVNDISECTDTSKLYVLPDGYIYAYTTTEVEAPAAYVNKLKVSECVLNERLSSSGGTSTSNGTGYFVTNYIPITASDNGKLLRYRGTTLMNTNAAFVMYDSSKALLGTASYTGGSHMGTDENGDSYITLGYGYSSSGVIDYDETKMAYIRLCFAIPSDGIDSVIITINEPIIESEGTVKECRWSNTGHAFIPANYEDRIIKLEKLVYSGSVVHGVVDNDNIITLTGILDGGTYTLKYENADGTTMEIGTIVIEGNNDNEDNEVTPTPTPNINLLTTALTPNDITTVFDGKGYKNGYYASAAEPFYNTDAAFFCTGLMVIPESNTFYIKGCTIDTALSHTRFGLMNESGGTINTAVLSNWGSQIALEELGTQYYRITLSNLSSLPTLPYYFYFSASGTGEGVIVSATPIE